MRFNFILRRLAPPPPPARSSLAGIIDELVPIVSECIGDTKKQVKQAAITCMTEATTVVGNRDIEPVLGEVVNCIVNPGETKEVVHKLAGTTFVQTSVTKACFASFSRGTVEMNSSTSLVSSRVLFTAEREGSSRTGT